MMPIEFSYECWPGLARLAARCFIKRRAGLALTVSGLVAILSLSALNNGFRQWFVIAGFTVSCCHVLVWFNYYLRSDCALRSMKDPTVTVRITDDSIEFETSELTSTVKWAGIKEVWRSADVWLLFTFSRNSYTAIPTAALDREREDIIKTKVTENGGKLR